MLKNKLKPYLEPLRTRQMTNREVAAILNVNENYLSQVLSKMKLVRVEAEFSATSIQKRKDLVAARKAFRKEVAHTLPTKEAAAAANCHPRTILRWKNA
jgi:hypothetical protein